MLQDSLTLFFVFFLFFSKKMEAPVFTKKRPKQQHVPTRHLLVLFAGKADFVEDDGHVQLVVLDNSARLFVSFDCVEAAEAAVARLRGTVSKDESSIRKSAIECYFCTSSLDSDEESSIPSVSLTKFVDAPPEGLTLECEFVTAEEESELLAFLDAQEWDSEIKRRVQHFGYSFDYKTRSVNPSFASFRPIPPILTSLFERLVKAGMPGNPDQISNKNCSLCFVCVCLFGDSHYLSQRLMSMFLELASSLTLTRIVRLVMGLLLCLLVRRLRWSCAAHWELLVAVWVCRSDRSCCCVVRRVLHGRTASRPARAT
jgi:hypothetical protein